MAPTLPSAESAGTASWAAAAAGAPQQIEPIVTPHVETATRHMFLIVKMLLAAALLAPRDVPLFAAGAVRTLFGLLRCPLLQCVVPRLRLLDLHRRQPFFKLSETTKNK